jgi:hypothetical protein
MDCGEVQQAADSFVAGELSPGTREEITTHLESCPRCRELIAASQLLRDGVRRAFERTPALAMRAEFVTALHSALRREANVPPPARRTARIARPMAIAASILLALGAAGVYYGRDLLAVSGALARLAVRDHRECALEHKLAGTSIPLDEAAERYGETTYGILAQLPDDIETAAGRAQVVRRHACVYDGRRFAHVVLTFRGQTVSLLVTAADGGFDIALPGEAAPHVTRARHVDEMPIVAFRAARYAVFLTGDVGDNDLAALAAAIAQPLYQELVG